MEGAEFEGHLGEISCDFDDSSLHGIHSTLQNQLQGVILTAIGSEVHRWILCKLGTSNLQGISSWLPTFQIWWVLGLQGPSYSPAQEDALRKVLIGEMTSSHCLPKTSPINQIHNLPSLIPFVIINHFTCFVGLSPVSQHDTVASNLKFSWGVEWEHFPRLRIFNLCLKRRRNWCFIYGAWSQLWWQNKEMDRKEGSSKAVDGRCKVVETEKNRTDKSISHLCVGQNTSHTFRLPCNIVLWKPHKGDRTVLCSSVTNLQTNEKQEKPIKVKQESS